MRYLYYLDILLEDLLLLTFYSLLLDSEHIFDLEFFGFGFDFGAVLHWTPGLFCDGISSCDGEAFSSCSSGLSITPSISAMYAISSKMIIKIIEQNLNKVVKITVELN